MSLQLAEQHRQRERNRRRWLPVGLGVAVLLLVWFGFSFAGLPWVTIGPATLVFLVASVVWLVWAISSLLGKTRPRPKGWIVVGLILAVTAAGVVVGLPTKARFAVGEPSFNSFVDKLGPPPAVVKDSDPVDVNCPSLIGLYAIDHCEVTDGGYLFSTHSGTPCSITPVLPTCLTRIFHGAAVDGGATGVAVVRA